MASSPQSNRQAPILGAVGFDGGSKPAIAFVIPAQQMTEEEAIAEGTSPECTFLVECWGYDSYREKCGFGFSACGDERYANCVIKRFGHRTIVYDEGDHECEDQEAKIGEDFDTPIVFTYDADARLASEPDGCDNSCAVADDFGSDDGTDDGLLEGDLPDGCSGPPVPDPTIIPLLPTVINFHQDNPDPEPDTIFDVITYDEEGGATTENWTLDVDECPTHRRWTWNETTVHSNEDIPSINQCFDESEADVDWTTTVTNYYDVTFSDLITTAEMVAAVIVQLATPSNFTYYTYNTSSSAPCQACWHMPDNELTAYYRTNYVRITNTSSFSINLTWDVATWAVDEEADAPCTATGSPSLDPGSDALAPGEFVDIEVYPDSSGANVVMQVINIACT